MPNNVAKGKSNIVTLSSGSKGFSFLISGDTAGAGELGLAGGRDAVKRYDRKKEGLIKALRAVNRAPSFDGITKEHISELSRRYAFVPFDYQIDNVLTMLNRFNARGVFGDQVGLGKTVQSLMCADVLYRLGAIRNALIVAPSKMCESWVREIKQKFPGIFDVVVCEGDLGECLGRISGQDGNKRCTLYVLNENALIRGAGDVIDEVTVSEAASKFVAEEPDGDFYVALGEIHNELLTRNSVRVNKLDAILKNYGYLLSMSEILAGAVDIGGSLEEMRSEVRRLMGKPLFKMTEKKYSALIEMLEKLPDSGLTSNQLLELKKRIKALKDEKELLSKKHGDGDERARLNMQEVDLLIVDEIHNFYVDAGSGNTKNKGGKLEEKTLRAVELLTDGINPGCYRILLSATPVRTRLEDVFDLVCIADRTRFGASVKEARAYFYSVLGVDADTPYKLSVIMSDENKRRIFFGLVNNFFTRRRIRSVNGRMGARITDSVSLRSFVEKEGLLGQMIDERYDSIKRSNDDYTAEACRDKAERQIACSLNNSWDDDEREAQIRHAAAAINGVILARYGELLEDIGKCNDEEGCEGLVAKAREYHGYINWQRPQKQGILIRPKSQADAETERAAENYDTVREYLKGCVDKTKDSDEECTKLLDELKIVEAYSSAREEKSDFKLMIPPELHNDIVRFGTNEIYHGIKPYYVGVCGEKHVVYVSKATARYEIRRKYGEDVVAVNASERVGLNMQQYHTLVFCQLSQWEGKTQEKLMEPADVEQWIGRIHRTGQLRNCRIITVLDCYTRKARSEEFLIWYYGLLSDVDGLDLYGNNTPDVAFVQPIAADIMRDMLSKAGETKVPEGDSFASLAERVFNTGNEILMGRVQRRIRELCSCSDLK